VTDLVVLVVELEEQGVEALGGVVHGARVRRVQDLLLVAVGEDDVEVALGDLAARRAVAVHPHGAQVHHVRVHLGVQHCGEQVVGPADVVVHGVAFVLGALHGVRRRALLCEVDDCVRSLLANQLHEELIVLRDIEVDIPNGSTRNLLPRLDTDFRMCYGSQ